MREAGLSGLITKKYKATTVRVPGVRVTDDLLDRDAAGAPNRCWVADITYLRTWEGWLYLVAVQDARATSIASYRDARQPLFAPATSADSTLAPRRSAPPRSALAAPPPLDGSSLASRPLRPRIGVPRRTAAVPLACRARGGPPAVLKPLPARAASFLAGCDALSTTPGGLLNAQLSQPQASSQVSMFDVADRCLPLSEALLRLVAKFRRNPTRPPRGAALSNLRFVRTQSGLS